MAAPIQARVIGPADAIDALRALLTGVSGIEVTPGSGLLPSRTPGTVRQYLILQLTSKEGD